MTGLFYDRKEFISIHPGCLETRVRGNGLPLIGAANERVGKADDDIIGRARELSDPMGAASHNRGIAKHLNPHVVYLKLANPVYPLLEHIVKDGCPIAGAAIRPGTSPFGRDDPLDRGPVTVDPGSCQILLDSRQHSSVAVWRTILVSRERRAQHQ